MSFRIGEVVRLKSGGPKMTVQYVDEPSSGNANVHCIWFDDSKMCTGQFPPTTLEEFVPTHQKFGRYASSDD